MNSPDHVSNGTGRVSKIAKFRQSSTQKGRIGMTLQIGLRRAAPQQELQVPGPQASNEAFSSFADTVAKLSSPEERSRCLRKVFDEAASNGHFETIEIIFKGREWLWAEQKFSAMASLVEHCDPSNREHREAVKDLFRRVASERRTVRSFRNPDEYHEYKAQVKGVLISVRKKDQELADWC